MKNKTLIILLNLIIVYSCSEKSEYIYKVSEVMSWEDIKVDSISWQQIPKERLTNYKTYLNSGDKDLSCFFKVAYNTKNIFIRVEVIDDIICNGDIIKERSDLGINLAPYFYDGLRIFINPKGKNAAANEVYSFIINYGSDQVQKVAPQMNSDVSNVKVHQSVENDKNILTISIPFHAIGITSINNLILGFEINIFDNDTKPEMINQGYVYGRECILAWAEEGYEYRSYNEPLRYGILIFEMN